MSDQPKPGEPAPPNIPKVRADDPASLGHAVDELWARVLRPTCLDLLQHVLRGRSPAPGLPVQAAEARTWIEDQWLRPAQRLRDHGDLWSPEEVIAALERIHLAVGKLATSNVVALILASSHVAARKFPELQAAAEAEARAQAMAPNPGKRSPARHPRRRPSGSRACSAAACTGPGRAT